MIDCQLLHSYIGRKHKKLYYRQLYVTNYNNSFLKASASSR
jgi:hypothetical protein